MNCNKNKHKWIIQDYRTLIGEQSEIIKQQQEQIKNLEKALIALKEENKSKKD